MSVTPVDSVDPFCYVRVVPDRMGDMHNPPEQGYTDFSDEPKPGYEPLYKSAVDPSFADALSDSEVRIWINACNYEPARQALRQLLAYRIRGVSSTPAPSQTAVEPVGELVERLRNIVTEFDNEVADMMSNDGGERADLWVDVDVPIGIVRQAASTLTAQAAALVAAEKRIAELEAGLDAAEAYNEEHGDPADTLHHGRSVLAHARRRTHQEKNNAG